VSGLSLRSWDDIDIVIFYGSAVLTVNLFTVDTRPTEKWYPGARLLTSVVEHVRCIELATSRC
jgi:hypothetical protein